MRPCARLRRPQDLGGDRYQGSGLWRTDAAGAMAIAWSSSATSNRATEAATKTIRPTPSSLLQWARWIGNRSATTLAACLTRESGGQIAEARHIAYHEDCMTSSSRENSGADRQRPSRPRGRRMLWRHVAGVELLVICLGILATVAWGCPSSCCHEDDGSHDGDLPHLAPAEHPAQSHSCTSLACGRGVTCLTGAHSDPFTRPMPARLTSRPTPPLQSCSTEPPRRPPRNDAA